MKKFSVTLEETVIYTMDVEAPNQEEAEETACEAWAHSSDPTEDFDGFGEGVTAIACVRRRRRPV